MRTALFIAPYFAPCSAVGAFRSIKLARHLPAAGWRPVVLSGTFPGDMLEPGLSEALPTEVHVADDYLSPTLLRVQLAKRRRAPAARSGPLRGLEPFHSPIDRYAAHAVHALSQCVRLARSQKAELVYASLGPHSAMPVAVAAARITSLPLVLDLRDPWALHETGTTRGADAASVRATAAVIRRLERACLLRADHIILNSDAMLEAYRREYPSIADKSSRIRNPFDAGLFEPPGPVAAPDRLRIVHLGTMRADTPIDDIAAGLRLLVDRERLGPSDAELVQIGHAGDHEREVVRRSGLEAFVRFEPRIPLRAALSAMRSAHVLLVASAPIVALRIPHKTYDYLASGMPILAISDNPELDELIGARPDSVRVPCRDPERVCAALAKHLETFRRTRALPEPVSPPRSLSAEHAASELAEIFDRVVSARRPRHSLASP